MLGLKASDGQTARDDKLAAPAIQRDDAKKARHDHAVLCRLLVDGGIAAMREVFDTIHPPICLSQRLANIHTSKLLERLRHRGVITPEQWSALYPRGREMSRSTDYDAALLELLLRHVCHLSAPYPNGWEGAPLDGDTSLAADLVRLGQFRRRVLSTDCVAKDAADSLSPQILVVLQRIGGALSRVAVEAAAELPFDDQQMSHVARRLADWERHAQRLANATAVADVPEGQHTQLSLQNAPLPTIETTHAAESTTTSRRESSGVTTLTPAGTGGLLTASLTREGTFSNSSSRRGSAIRHPGDFLQQDRQILLDYHKLLVENVRSDVVLPKLVKAGVLSHEEKNSLGLATRNVDRMRALLRVLPTKQRIAFSAFCEALKFKYTAIYEQLARAKKIAMEKPDDITEASTNLRASHRMVLARFSPVPWHPSAVIDVREFYTPLRITDYRGREWSPATIFEVAARMRRGRGRRVMLEGESGSGKSTVCRYLTTEWAHGHMGAGRRFRLVYYVEVKLLKNSLAETVLEYNHDSSYSTSPGELSALLDAFQHDVLLILDGLEDLAPKVTEEVMQLLEGRLYPQSTVLVTLNSTYVTPALLRNFDTKLVVMGLESDCLQQFVMRYSALTAAPEETQAVLLEQIVSGANGGDPAVHILAQNPQLCMCMCLLCETGTPLEASTTATTTALLEAFLQALLHLHCRRRKLKVTGDDLPKEVQTLAQDIEETAWRCMHQNGSFFTYEQTDNPEHGNPMFALGILKRRASSALPSLQQLFFTNRVFQDFMAARVLCRLDPEDLSEYVDSLVKDSYYCNVTKYFCGLLKDDKYTCRLGKIIDGIAQENVSHWRGYTATPLEEVAGRRLRTPGVSEGRMGDFKLSLECLTECEGRTDMKEIIAKSLPVRIFSRNKKTLTQGVILGLAHLLQLQSSPVQELEIRLDHFTRYHIRALRILSHAISWSQPLCELKLRWSEPDLLADMLGEVFSRPCSVKGVSCFDMSPGVSRHHVSASVWANMQGASRHMGSVTDFMFANCQNKAMVTCMLHSLPYSIQNLHVVHCAVDLVSSQELALRIEKAHDLTALDLTGVHLRRPNFSYICSGLRLSNSLHQLTLTGTNLDATSFEALAAALKFNRSLRNLDLSDTHLSDSACAALSKAVCVNNSVSHIAVNGSHMSPTGSQALRRIHPREGPVFLGTEILDERPMSQSRHLSDMATLCLPPLR